MIITTKELNKVSGGLQDNMTARERAESERPQEVIRIWDIIGKDNYPIPMIPVPKNNKDNDERRR
ncbi:MAG: hypothetical protein K5745_05110 [Saccharofermentans sp.]|nr:hypothetical protein [Saccharofermentans sp.]